MRPGRDGGHQLPGSSRPGPHALGGALMRKLVGLFAGAAILVAACGGTSPTTAPTTAPSTAPASVEPASPAASGEPSPSAGSGEVDLFTTTYAPEAGTT